MEGAAGSLSLVTGQTLDKRYTLIGRLGSGRYCDVWRARDELQNYDVALKVLKDPANRDQLFAEWQTQRALNHAAFLRVFEFHDADQIYFALYYLDGTTLQDLLPLSTGEAISIARLLIDAAGYLHARDVIHGDIAPANVLIDRGGAMHLVDFGSAARGEQFIGLGTGTPGLQRPERATAVAPVPADDWFALGSLLLQATESDIQSPERDSLRALALKMQGDADTCDRKTLLAELEKSALRGKPIVTARVAALVSKTGHESLPPVTPVSTPRAPAVLKGNNEGSRTGGVSRAWVLGGIAILGMLAIYVVVFLEPPEPVTATQAGVTETPIGKDGAQPEQVNVIDDLIEFSEGGRNDSMRTDAVRDKNATDRALGELLTKQEVLESRGVDRWGGTDYQKALEVYSIGDRYYLTKNYGKARQSYQESIAMLDQLIERIDSVFSDALSQAEAAFLAGDSAQARRFYENALAISQGDKVAEAGLARATKLDDVLALTRSAQLAERDGELQAALETFQQALALDPAWQSAIEGNSRVAQALLDRNFRDLMSEGFFAFDEGRLNAARNAFTAARKLKPGSREPVDGLQQVDQRSRLKKISSELARAEAAERSEDWEAARDAYRQMLAADANLVQARDGVSHAQARIALDKQLQQYLNDPDRLSEQAEIEAASSLLLKIARIDPQGPKLVEQKAALSRVLKRAASPLTVQLVSDAQTDVAVYRVGKLGKFESRALELRPGVYTVVGSRPGFKDVRLTVRVAPEVPMEPVLVQCVEPI